MKWVTTKSKTVLKIWMSFTFETDQDRSGWIRWILRSTWQGKTVYFWIDWKEPVMLRWGTGVKNLKQLVLVSWALKDGGYNWIRYSLWLVWSIKISTGWQQNWICWATGQLTLLLARIRIGLWEYRYIEAVW